MERWKYGEREKERMKDIDRERKRDPHDPSDMDLYHLTEQQSQLKMKEKTETSKKIEPKQYCKWKP